MRTIEVSIKSVACDEGVQNLCSDDVQFVGEVVRDALRSVGWRQHRTETSGAAVAIDGGARRYEAGASLLFEAAPPPETSAPAPPTDQAGPSPCCQSEPINQCRPDPAVQTFAGKAFTAPLRPATKMRRVRIATRVNVHSDGTVSYDYADFDLPVVEG